MIAFLTVSILAAAQSDLAVAQGEKSNSRIQAVIDTLEDLLQSVQGETVEEEKSYKCFVDWCDKEQEGRRSAIEDTELALNNLGVSVDQMESAATRYKFVIKQNGEDAGEIQDALAQAESIRNEEKGKYEDARAGNMQSVQQLDTAIQLVEQGQGVGFLQTKFKQLISAPGESGFVLGMFKSLKQNMESNQAMADEVESQKVNSYESMRKTKTDQLSLVQKDTQDKKTLLAETNRKHSDAKNDIKSESESLEAAKAALEDVHVDCTDRQNSWKRKSEDRAAEIGAIQEAISYLTIAFRDNATDSAVAFVQMKVESLTSALVRVSAKKDYFSSVKEVIGNLVTTLEGEEKAEYQKKNWCLAEYEKNEKTNETQTHEFKVMSASVSKSEALVQQLLQEANGINATLNEQGQAEEQARKLRKDQKATYEKGAKDRALALKVLTEARTVLQKFYASQKPAFVQETAVESAVQRPDLQEGRRHTTEGNVVIVMLDNIADDIRREIAAADKEEKAAALAFESYVVDNRHEFDASMMEITDKVTRRARLEVQLHAAKEDKESMSETMTAFDTQMKATVTECNDVVENFDERSKARNFEIDQLKDAREILSGAGLAVRTGFLEAQKKFISLKTHDEKVRQLQRVARTVESAIGM